ncbi:MAG: GNAT family N-acetyltransferase [Nitratireductor sp.]
MEIESVNLNSHGVPKVFATEKSSPKPFGAIGNLEVRLAQDETEISQVLAMREQVFQLPKNINVDRYDAVCDHLLVLDKNKPYDPDTGKVVGTYRLINQEHANKVGGFYSSQEFEIQPLLENNKRLKFLEFGRSCVLPEYRGKRTLELLWAGSWAYIKQHQIDVLFGCASFNGCEPATHQEALSFLHHFADPAKEFDANVVSKFKGQYERLNKQDIDAKRAIKNLPPLIKGYLRVGAKFGTQIAIDEAFGTIDLLTILPVKNIDPKYIAYYGANAQKHAC